MRDGDPGGARPQEETVRIALQYGLAYAPLVVAGTRGLLERLLPGTIVEWVQAGNAATIREAMLAGRLDVGFMGIPPFLIGVDRGMEWRLFTGLCEAPLALVTRDAGLRRLSDLGPTHRLAVPQPGSIQHILLSMASEREFGDPSRFDNQLVTLAHPDAMTALVAGGEVSAHFAPPPYLFEELALPGSRAILTGEEAFGGSFTFIVGVASSRFFARPDGERVLAALSASIVEAAALLAGPDDSLLRELAGIYDLAPETLRTYLDAPGLRYGAEVLGLGRFADAMHRFGYLSAPVDVARITFMPGDEAPPEEAP